jgi:hypothetical protein
MAGPSMRGIGIDMRYTQTVAQKNDKTALLLFGVPEFGQQ